MSHSLGVKGSWWATRSWWCWCGIALWLALGCALAAGEETASLTGEKLVSGDTVTWTRSGKLLVVCSGQVLSGQARANLAVVKLPSGVFPYTDLQPVTCAATDYVALAVMIAPPGKTPVRGIVLLDGNAIPIRTVATSGRMGVGDRQSWLAWSPDGSEFAYVGDKVGGGSYSTSTRGATEHDGAAAPVPFSAIWLVNANTGAERQLTTTPKCEDMAPAFSPDGSRLVFSRLHPDRSLALNELPSDPPAPMCTLTSVVKATGESIELTGGSVDLRPVFSPDGKHLAFIRLEPQFSSLWLLDVSSGKTHRLVSGALYEGLTHTRLQWDAEGLNVLFTCAGDLFAAPASGGLPHRLTRGAGVGRQWALSPDIQTVAFPRGGDIITASLSWPSKTMPGH